MGIAFDPWIPASPEEALAQAFQYIEHALTPARVLWPQIVGALEQARDIIGAELMRLTGGKTP